MKASAALAKSIECASRIVKRLRDSLSQDLANAMHEGATQLYVKRILDKDEIDKLVENGYVIRYNTDKRHTFIMWDEGREVGEVINETPDRWYD